MNKWKLVYNTTFTLLIVFIMYVVNLFVSIYIGNHKYPYEALGVITVNNKFSEFLLELEFRLIVFGIPLILDIIFLIISYKKTKKHR